MDGEFFRLITDQTGVLLLAGVMIWIMKGWHESSVKRADERATRQKQAHEVEIARLEQAADEHKADKAMLAGIVKANTESNIRLIGVVERIERFIQERIGNGTGS